MIWLLDLYSKILTRQINKLGSRTAKLVTARDRIDEKSTNKWFAKQLGKGTMLPYEQDRQHPIDDMIDIVSEPATSTRTTATKATWTATNVAGQVKDKTTSATDKARTTTKTAGQRLKTKATSDNTTGNIPAWLAACDNTTTKATFARLLLDNNPEATSKEATFWWATLGHDTTTFKSLLATLSRMRRGN